jgi:CheY-like chemotaxis protein
VPTILAVDDSPSDIQLVVAHLSAARPEWAVFTVDTGEKALERIAESTPDIVISDLRMPEMDGLELIGKLKQSHPHLPAIILTGNGSESLAVEALAAGAASYVSKSELSNCLADTIDQVLDRVRLNHSYGRLVENLDQIDHRYTLENDPALIPPLVDLVQEMAYGVYLVDASQRHQIGIAVERPF